MGDTLKLSLHDGRVGEILWLCYLVKPLLSIQLPVQLLRKCCQTEIWGLYILCFFLFVLSVIQHLKTVFLMYFVHLHVCMLGGEVQYLLLHYG